MGDEIMRFPPESRGHHRRGQGGYFDPDVVDAFMAIHARFKKTAFDLADSEAARNAL